jgi:hypothetical protein
VWPRVRRFRAPTRSRNAPLARADSKVELARSLIGMVVRAGAAKPDIGTVAALRSTLLAAKSIAYSDSGSGTYLTTTLFPKLGIADDIAGKSRKVRGPPSGEPVAAVVARGEAEIGFQQVSELIRVPGISFVGASARGAAGDFFRGRSDQHIAAAGGGACAAPLPRIARGSAGDHQGRALSDCGTIARRAIRYGFPKVPLRYPAISLMSSSSSKPG